MKSNNINIPRGLSDTPEWIILKSREVCGKKNCDFRKDCKGAENGRESKFDCHYGELIRRHVL